ncbi:MAG: hypothetical protein RL885_16920 [Planctomycetota bacterium]
MSLLAAAAAIALYVLIDGGALDDPQIEPVLAELVQRARPADARTDVLSLNVEGQVVASIRGVSGDFRIDDGEVRWLEPGTLELEIPSSWVAALLVMAKQPDALEAASIEGLIRSLERRWLPQEVLAETGRYLPGATRESFHSNAASVVEALARSSSDWTLAIEEKSIAVRFFSIREPSSVPPGPSQWVVALAPTESSLLAMTTRSRSGVSSDVSWSSGELWVDVTTATSATLALIGVDEVGQLHTLAEQRFDAEAEESATFGPIEAHAGSKLRQVIVLASASETKLRAELERVSNGSLEANRDRWIAEGLLVGEYELPD